MTPNRDELHHLCCRIEKLTAEEQVMLAEHILRNIRQEHFTDHESYRRSLQQDFDELRAAEANQHSSGVNSEAARATG